AAERGAKVFGLVPTTPIKSVLNFRSGFALDMIENWNEFLHLPDKEKIAAMRDPAMRKQLQDGLDRSPAWKIGNYRIEDVRSAKNARFKGRLVREIADEMGLTPLNALLELAAEEELWISFSSPPMGADEESWRLRGRVWQDKRCIVGGSD